MACHYLLIYDELEYGLPLTIDTTINHFKSQVAYFHHFTLITVSVVSLYKSEFYHMKNIIFEVINNRK